MEYRTFPALQHNHESKMYTRRYPLQLLEANKNSTDAMRHLKMVFLGESRVGKSSIISQKVSYKFDAAYAPTMEDYFVKVHRIAVEDIDLDSMSLSQRLSMSASQKQSHGDLSKQQVPCFHCILDIQDTAGSLDLRQNISQWIWRSQVFVVVFDVADRATFADVENAFIARIVELRHSEQPPMVLVGNRKGDAEDR